MKVKRSETVCKVNSLPEIVFRNDQLTSFSGLVILQAFFKAMNLREIFGRCFRASDKGSYPLARLFLLLVVHLMLGFRRLRTLESCQDDPILKETVGLTQLPAISTWTERLNDCPEFAREKLREENRKMVLNGLVEHGITSLTFDYDGTVQGTRRKAEMTAVGFNPKRKGQRSYYPLLCTVAQSGQVFDVLHRSGNVHDSNGAGDFMLACIQAAQTHVEGVRIESRMDSAFFNEEILTKIGPHVKYTASVAFMRFEGLKADVENRKRWNRIDGEWSYFEKEWKPESWKAEPVRLFIVRRRQKKQQKEPLQLDLFEPVDFEYQYSVIASNKTEPANEVIDYHHGRGSQEGVIGELKDQMNMDYVPFRHRIANELYMWASIWGHNLFRRMGMAKKPARKLAENKRPALWIFEKAQTIREDLLHRPGRVARPGNQKVLTVSATDKMKKKFTTVLNFWKQAA